MTLNRGDMTLELDTQTKNYLMRHGTEPAPQRNKMGGYADSPGRPYPQPVLWSPPKWLARLLSSAPFQR